MESKYEQLSQLKTLLDSGALTQEEFDEVKRKILDAPEEDMLQEKPKSKPYSLSQETNRQRPEAFERLPEHKLIVRRGAFIGGSIAISIIFLIIFALTIFFAMLFGWEGVGEAFKNLFGLYKSEY